MESKKENAGQVQQSPGTGAMVPISEKLPSDPFQLSTAGIDSMVHNTQMRVDAIQAIYGKIMRKDSDYGVIPGCGNKPALLKPGAEKIIMAFRLAPTTTHTVTDLGNGHREIVVRTTLSAADGTLLGDGVGSCSTMETKYRYRQAERACPTCGKSTIIKGKEEYGGGWLCFAKKGGCGAKFLTGDASIEKQNIGRIENTDLADQYNTVLKMAEKRSLVDVVLRVAGASDIFTQDIEENAQAAESTPAGQQQAGAKKQTPLDQLMEKLKAAEFISTEIDSYLINKLRWLPAGGVLPDLSESRVDQLLKGYDAFITSFKAWNNARKVAGQ